VGMAIKRFEQRRVQDKTLARIVEQAVATLLDVDSAAKPSCPNSPRSKLSGP
jgi:anti-sigma-K factor RskA